MPRALPAGLGAEIADGSWPVPPVFDLVGEAAGVGRAELRSTLNLGIGMVLVVAEEDADEVVRRAEDGGTQAFRLGSVVAGGGVRFA